MTRTRRSLCLVLPLAAMALVAPRGARAQRFDVSASTALGAAVDDAIRGAQVMADGTVVVAGTLSGAMPGGASPALLNGATATSAGVVMRLSPDGRRVLSAARVASTVSDLASDARGNLYVAGGPDGLIVLDASATTVVRALRPGHVHRVDVAPDGTAAALVPSNAGAAESTPGAGQIYVYGPDGAQLGMFAGYRNTLDVAIDGASRMVIAVGWRQDNAFDGTRTEPVQIAYLRGYTVAGEVRWTDYDWSVDRAASNFINRPTNNMADTRGLRVAVGRDGQLYAAFECAGGNHIFRYDPQDITRAAMIVGGDAYHTFSNTRSEHKTFFARYAPATGAYVTGQQLVGRLGSGAGNTVRVSEGAITADERGRVYIAGAAAFGLPLTFTPPMTGTYTGGAYLVVMSADLRTRLYVTRLDPGGGSRAVDARVLGGGGDEATVVLGGHTSMGGMEFYSANPLQPAIGGGRDGFVAVFNGAGATPGDGGGPPVAPDGGGDGGASERDGGAGDGGGGTMRGGCGCAAAGHARCAWAGLAWTAAALVLAARRRRAR